MEANFVQAWMAARRNAQDAGIRLRPVTEEEAMTQAHRMLSGHRESDGFAAMEQKGLLRYSLEALAVDKRFTGLFSDEEANNALTRLLDAGFYR